MVKVKLFVEGGGSSNILRTNCRHGFSEFLRRAGLEGVMPRIIACGRRQAAFDAFCTAVKNGERAFLLVDSETPVKASHQNGGADTWHPFAHLHENDNWDKPEGAEESSCHLMTQCMETWLVADVNTLAGFFGNKFNANALPSSAALDNMPKADIYNALRRATAQCSKKYDKGDHSFEILKSVDPVIVILRCVWAKRFVDTLRMELTA